MDHVIRGGGGGGNEGGTPGTRYCLGMVELLAGGHWLVLFLLLRKWYLRLLRRYICSDPIDNLQPAIRARADLGMYCGDCRRLQNLAIAYPNTQYHKI